MEFPKVEFPVKYLYSGCMLARVFIASCILSLLFVIAITLVGYELSEFGKEIARTIVIVFTAGPIIIERFNKGPFKNKYLTF